MSELRLYRFDRIANGQRMAEGIRVRALTLFEAERKADKLREACEVNERLVLDFAIPCLGSESDMEAMRRAVFIKLDTTQEDEG